MEEDASATAINLHKMAVEFVLESLMPTVAGQITIECLPDFSDMKINLIPRTKICDLDQQAFKPSIPDIKRDESMPFSSGLDMNASMPSIRGMQMEKFIPSDIERNEFRDTFIPAISEREAFNPSILGIKRNEFMPSTSGIIDINAFMPSVREMEIEKFISSKIERKEFWDTLIPVISDRQAFKPSIPGIKRDDLIPSTSGLDINAFMASIRGTDIEKFIPTEIERKEVLDIFIPAISGIDKTEATRNVSMYKAYCLQRRFSCAMRRMSPEARATVLNYLTNLADMLNKPKIKSTLFFLIKFNTPPQYRFAFEFGMESPSLMFACDKIFPDAMATGPEQHFCDAGPMSPLCNKEISLTCLLLSVLAYRTPTEVKKASKVLLQDWNILSVSHPKTNIDAYVFIDPLKRFAIVAVRGTESQSPRSWLTSIDLSLKSISDDSPVKVRSSYWQATESICYQKLEPVWPPARAVQGPSLLEYIQDFKKAQPGTAKIYLTGHSLGGGVASVMGLILAEKLILEKQLVPDAVVTFGSPQVGNLEFKLRQETMIRPIWRFVHGDEFAAMSPPIPFGCPTTDCGKDEELDQYHHVGTLIETKPPWNGFSNEDTDRNIETMANRLHHIVLNGRFRDCVYDHDPFNHVRWLLGEMRNSNRS